MAKTQALDNNILKKMPFLSSNILTSGELREGRLVIVIMVMGTVLILQFLISSIMLINANAAIAEAYKNQQFHLYPQANGVYVPKKVMPEDHILGFVNTFQAYYYNWDPESVRANMNAASSLMIHNFSVTNEPQREQWIQQSENQLITQVVGAIRSRSEDKLFNYLIEPLSHGFKVTYSAKRRQLIENDVYLREIGKISLVLQRILPTAEYAWGLRVFTIEEEWTKE